MRKNIYAFYRDGELLFHGTKEDIAEETHFSMSTIHNYSSPSYLEKNKDKNVIKIIKVGWEEWKKLISKIQ